MIVLLPLAGGVVVVVVLTGVGGWEIGAAAVVIGLCGGTKFEEEEGIVLVDMPVVEVGVRALGEVMGRELPAMLEAVTVALDVGTGPPPAGAVPRDGAAWQVAWRLSVKLLRPSGWRGSEGPAGRVPT